MQYTFAELPTLALADCCTVHKRHGSEHATVVMAVNRAHSALSDRTPP